MGRAGRHAAVPARGVTYRQVLADREFRSLVGAQFLSLLGDQLARIALAVLVFSRSGSALLTAATYAVSLVPWLIAGPLLSPVSDRLPRRQFLIGCDVARAVLVAVMALPAMPLAAMFGLLLAASFLEPPFQAARSALVPEILDARRYPVGLSMSLTGQQVGQVLGFAFGGAAVAALSARGALAIDAATFVVSAALVAFGVRRRPVPRTGSGGLTAVLADARAGATLVLRSPVLRRLTLLAWAGSTFTVAPEGLAVVYARHHGGGAVAAGLLTAAMPLGVVIGALVVSRLLGPAQRARAMVPLALACHLPLIATLLQPRIGIAFALWALSGFCGAFMIVANERFVRAVAPGQRAAAYGVTGTGVYALQGLGLAVAGALAGAVGTGAAIGVCGLLGCVTVAAVVGHGEDRDVWRSSFSLGRPSVSVTEERVPTL